MHPTLSLLLPFFALSLAHHPPNHPPNQIAGVWTLTTVNVTTNGTISFPYGDRPQGFLFNAPAPDFTWIEELNVRNGSGAPAAAQSNAGTYVVDENGAFVNRTTLASTIPSNIGLSENTTVFRLERLNATALFQTIFADSYTTGYGIWTRFVPGSTEV